MTASPPPDNGAATPSSPISWSDPERAHAFAQWLAAVGPRHRLLPATARPASADASFRRYFRIDTEDPAGTRIVMDAPPAQENSAPFVQVARLMRDAGLTA